MSRLLRPLNESECYSRLYGERVPTVVVLRGPAPKRPEGGLLEEQMRRIVDERFGFKDDYDLPRVQAA